METIDVHIRDVLRKRRHVVVLRLRGTKAFRFRLWIAAKLIRLAAWIASDVVKLEDERV